MRNLMIISALLFSISSFSQQGEPHIQKPTKETLRERCIREGFKTDGVPKQEHLWLIELGKRGYSNENAIKEIERRKSLKKED